MSTFLSNVVDDILLKNNPISEYSFILPSKRAGNFLKKEIKSKLNTPVLFPEILSIEDFIYELSSITSLDTTSILFEFYTIYLKHTPEELRENFDAFVKWGVIALQDFNEIDRHLVDSNYLFDYLKSIDRLENWNIEKGSETQLIKKHISFFDRLQNYYTHLYDHLLIQKIGYQGLQYREAFESLHNYIENNRHKRLVFVGFNALNKAEELIIKELLENELATIYWDADKFYFKDHPASIFLRNYKYNWNYHQHHPFNWVGDHFDQKKNIHLIGAPKNNAQVKYVGELLSNFKNQSFENTALVLADETLLPAMLSSLPKTVEQVNITMGYELANMPISALLEALFSMHTHSKTKGDYFYYKNVVQILNHSSIKKMFNPNEITSTILKNNLIYINKKQLTAIAKDYEYKFDNLSFLFENWNNDAHLALENAGKLILLLKEKTDNALEREFLFKNHTIIKQLEQLNASRRYIRDIKTLHHLYKQLVKTEKLSFQGEPLSGLQIMGMLETRVLDFENVILTSLNEGILPAGKTGNSFVPFDVKKEVGLPTYQERDAVFSYHFYRLLQRARNIYLLYNTENDQYGSGEQSRFLTELEVYKPDDIQKYVVSPKVYSSKPTLVQIKKSSGICEQLKQLALKGISPTALTNYINNPLNFYEQKILGIKEAEEAEETVAANTLGTVIHKVLEVFYLPYKGQFLTQEAILLMKKSIKSEVKTCFECEYKNGDISTGKNLLIYNVAQQFITNFLNEELQLLKSGNQLKILELEHDLQSEISIEGIDFPIKLVGQADRIDEMNGVLRIIDYKTGKVAQKDLTINDWSQLTLDYKYSKSFQVLLYALLYGKMKAIDFGSQPIESGIISFKTTKSGFLKVNNKTITNEDMANFTMELKRLIAEIYNSEVPFTENENAYF